MNSFILITKDSHKRKAYIASFCAENNISTFDQIILQTENPTIGIEMIRDMQKGIPFKPLKGEKRSITIENAQLLTPEAQNALLKLLEEPPLHTFFFLSADSDTTFLPTILSRCTVVTLQEEDTSLTIAREEELLRDFQALTQHNSGLQLALAEELSSDKEKAKEWLEHMILFLHQKMLNNPEKSRKVATILKHLQDTYTTSKTTNTNLRLLLEHAFLTI